MLAAVTTSSSFAVRGMLGWCRNISLKYPGTTSTLSGGVIAMAGDVACQKMEGARTLDWRRTSNMFVYRALIFGPQYWYILRGLEKYVTFAGTPFKTIASKIALDQFVFGPIAIAQFYVCMTCLEGGSLRQGLDKLWSVGGETLRSGWSVWIPIQALTFGVIPPAARLQFVSTVQVGWNAWLSKINNDARQSRECTIPVKPVIVA